MSKIRALRQALMYRPLVGGTVIVLSLLVAALEGVGLGFIIPIVELTQSSTPATNADGLLNVFVQAYAFLGIPFELEWMIVGVIVVMGTRFTLSFLVAWLRATYATGYQRDIRQQLFESLAYAPINYLDREGSDELLNSLITEANRAGGIISGLLSIIETGLRGFIYLAIAALLSPTLTAIAVIGLGVSTFLVRFVLEPAYDVGTEVAEVNSRLQTLSQTGVQGMRDVRLFNQRTELINQMRNALDGFMQSNVRLTRNQSALSNLNQLMNSIVVFGLVFISIRFTSFTLGEIGVFLFALFRLSPTLTGLNRGVYSLDSQLPHLIRVQSRIRELNSADSPDTEGGKDVRAVTEVAFDDVTFSYAGERPVLRDVSFAVKRGEHIALVGQSGAGKSTIVSLLGRLQSPDSGRIRADGTDISEFDVTQWRSRLAVVRQNPYIFNETLWKNVTVGDRSASRRAVEHACKMAGVSEFFDELPEGYETELGDEGVRLSGGQQQRIAIARALLKDADVLVLDEATSELDSGIEREVRENIARMGEDYAIVSIAHQLSMISDVDRIYALESGTITESGTHDELLATGGTYADLYLTQS